MITRKTKMKSKEIQELIKLAETQGWRVEKSNGGHYKWMSPTGKMVITSATPSDKRAFANIQSDLRRYGLVLVKKNPRRKDRLQ
jgi:predicted RNA binding protein YcfA (HicA-like mRNA interferase family)